MENSENKSNFNLITGIVVCIILLVMMVMKSSEIKKENETMRSGTAVSTK